MKKLIQNIFKYLLPKFKKKYLGFLKFHEKIKDLSPCKNTWKILSKHIFKKYTPKIQNKKYLQSLNS